MKNIKIGKLNIKIHRAITINIFDTSSSDFFAWISEIIGKNIFENDPKKRTMLDAKGNATL